MINFKNKNILFGGNLGKKGEESIVNNNEIKNVVYYLANDFCIPTANSKMLIDQIKKRTLYIVANCIDNDVIFGNEMLDENSENRLLNGTKKVYVTMERADDGKYNELCGALTFYITTNGKYGLEDKSDLKFVKK